MEDPVRCPRSPKIMEVGDALGDLSNPSESYQGFFGSERLTERLAWYPLADGVKDVELGVPPPRHLRQERCR